MTSRQCLLLYDRCCLRNPFRQSIDMLSVGHLLHAPTPSVTSGTGKKASKSKATSSIDLTTSSTTSSVSDTFEVKWEQFLVDADPLELMIALKQTHLVHALEEK